MEQGTLNTVGQILAFALLALWPYIAKGFKNWLKGKGDYLSTNIKIRRQIDAIIKEIRIRMEANRVIMCEFSNTEKSTGGFPFEFLSVTYEAVDPNMTSIKDSVQKRHVSAALDWLEPIETDRYFMFQIQDLSLSEEVRFTMRQLLLHTVIVFKITDHLKDGFIALHFVDPYLDDWKGAEGKTISNDDHIHMRFQANRIITLMRQLKK